MPTGKDILASGGPVDSNPIKDYVGDTFTITDFVFASGPNGSFVYMDVITSDGEEVKVRTGAKSVISKLENLRANDALPIEVLVSQYPTNKGNPGFDIVNPED